MYNECVYLFQLKGSQVRSAKGRTPCVCGAKRFPSLKSACDLSAAAAAADPCVNRLIACVMLLLGKRFVCHEHCFPLLCDRC